MADESKVQAELHQLQTAHAALQKDFKQAQDDIKVLRELNSRGDAALRQAQAAVESSKSAMVRFEDSESVLSFSLQFW